MKPRRGCEACRQRHRKCLVPAGSSICSNCSESGRVCNFEPKFKFKFTTPRQTARPTPPDHDSPRPPTQLSQASFTPQTKRPKTRDRDTDTDPRDEVSNATNATTSHGQAPSPHNTGIGSQSDNAFSTAIVNSSVASIPFMLSDYPTTTTTTATSAGISTPSTTTLQASNSHHNQNVPQHSRRPQEQTPSPLLTQRHAFLFRTFVDKLAPVADACDDARHFTTVVPRLALEEPMILKAILALASRYDFLKNRIDSSDLEATYHHNRCIELLIEAFARSPETYDSTLLTAVVLSRLYEEYDPDSDSHQHHLAGTRNLLNHTSVARFVTEGGLAEAASWLHLRQAIYVFLVRRKPVEVSLKSFRLATAFRNTDDGSYSNRMVYLFAKILKSFFPSEVDSTESDVQSPMADNNHDVDTWQILNEEVQAWLLNRPLTFHPIHYESPDAAKGSSFPKLWMISSAAVIGLQHYYAARVIFSLQECHNINPNAGFTAAKTRRDNERAISDHLGYLMGLAISNRQTENAFFLPSHMLSLCGYCIQHVAERDHTIQFLRQVKEVLEWKTESLIASLRDQWAELDSLAC